MLANSALLFPQKVQIELFELNQSTRFWMPRFYWVYLRQKDDWTLRSGRMVQRDRN